MEAFAFAFNLSGFSISRLATETTRRAEELGFISDDEGGSSVCHVFCSHP